MQARPSVITEEVEINFLNSKMWIPGRRKVEEIYLTYPDAENDEGCVLFMAWMKNTFSIIERACVIIRTHFGDGKLLEEWTLENAFVSNFDVMQEQSYDLPPSVSLTIQCGGIDYTSHVKVFSDL